MHLLHAISHFPSLEEVVENINPVQRQAICHGEGPMLVLAGPGSGKTFVITRRIRHLIMERNVAPENILVITFTKNSADEMEQRFRELMGAGYPVRFGTFHAIFFQMLSVAYGYDGNNIIREKDKRIFMRSVIERVESDEPLYEYVERILSDISRVKNEGIRPSEASINYISNELFVKIYDEYRKILRSEAKLDFDDMVLECREMLREGRELRKWQELYKYILIDEFQDINPMQYDVINMLTANTSNLFVVGDDDQSIYGFRGSRPDIMKAFPVDYKGTKVINLSINYRSRQDIVDKASSLITCNKNRYNKKLEANNKLKGQVILKAFDDQKKESEYIVKLIETTMRMGRYSDIAVIYRTNGAARFLTKELTDRHIPYNFREKPVSFFSHDIAKDILAMLAFVSGQRNRQNFLRFMNKPVRYITREMVMTMPSENIDIRRLLGDSINKPYLYKNIDKLLRDMEYLARLDMYAGVKYIRRIMGYEEWLIIDTKEKGKDIIEAKEELDLIEECAKGKETYADMCSYIEEYEMALRDASINSDDDRINILTMHGSKGLEYKTVILPDLSEGYVPQSKAVSIEAIEEERRVFYVAMTRAKDNLYLTYVKKNKINRHDKSRFLSEIHGLKES